MIRIEAVQADGTRVDVTEGVQAAYDLVIQSMDWGSGFLSIEDVVPMAHLAHACGFEQVDEAAKYLRVKADQLQQWIDNHRSVPPRSENHALVLAERIAEFEAELRPVEEVLADLNRPASTHKTTD